MNIFKNLYVLATDIGLDVIENVRNGGESDTKYLATLKAEETLVFQDIYTVLMYVGFFGGVLMLIVGFVAYMLPTNSQEKAKAKTKILWILVGIFLLCMAATIVGWIHNAGTQF